MSLVLGAFGRWISQCYAQFSHGARFEKYEMFICLSLQILWGGGRDGKPPILNPRLRGSACIAEQNVTDSSFTDSL